MTTTHFFGDTTVLTWRSLRHILRSPDTIITTAVTPVALMLLFVFVFGGAIDTGSMSYIDYMLPGILLITIASGIAYTAYRLFLDLQGGIFERFQSMPIARSSSLWAHVLTSLVANLASIVIVVGVALLLGFRTGAGVAGVARRCRHPGAVHPRPDLDRRDRGAVGQDRGRRERVLVPAHLPAVHQLGLRADRHDAGPGRLVRREPAGDARSSTRFATSSRGQPVGTDIWVALAWCVGILVVAYFVAMAIYRRKISLQHSEVLPPADKAREGFRVLGGTRENPLAAAELSRRGASGASSPAFDRAPRRSPAPRVLQLVVGLVDDIADGGVGYRGELDTQAIDDFSDRRIGGGGFVGHVCGSASERCSLTFLPRFSLPRVESTHPRPWPPSGVALLHPPAPDRAP